MKFFHLSDLHIGKTLHHYNLREDQENILNQVIQKAEELNPDAILIAGDVYDKSMPSAEAVNIFDDFLTRLTLIRPAIPIIIISGNHDSGERLDFASGILKHHQVYLSGKVPESSEESLRKVTLEDEHGKVHFWLLPFVKPAYVKHLWEEGESKSYHDTVQELINREHIDFANERNVLLSHQFYINGKESPLTSDSETISVGGIDQVDVRAVKDFDYVALGHLHRPQKVGEEKIRYCGTLLKYSVSEADHKKSLTVVELPEKDAAPIITAVPLKPLRDVRRKSGTLEEVLANAVTEDLEDYVGITLTDERELFMPKEQLQGKYGRILEVRLENRKTREGLTDPAREAILLEPFAVFRDFYEKMRGRELSDQEAALMEEIFDQAKEEQQG